MTVIYINNNTINNGGKKIKRTKNMIDRETMEIALTKEEYE